MNDQNTFGFREVQITVLLVLLGDLAKHAVSEDNPLEYRLPRKGD
jgi:hypothetical protein